MSQQSFSSSQGLSKVRPKGLGGSVSEVFWDDLGFKMEVGADIGSISKLSSSSCKP